MKAMAIGTPTMTKKPIKLNIVEINWTIINCQFLWTVRMPSFMVER
jgi:hypothetical protein